MKKYTITFLWDFDFFGVSIFPTYKKRCISTTLFSYSEILLFCLLCKAIHFRFYITTTIHYTNNGHDFCIFIRNIEYKIIVKREHSQISTMPRFSFVSAKFLRHIGEIAYCRF